MAAIPEASLTITDGALGIAPSNTTRVQVKVGTCSSGTANTVYTFTDPKTMRDTLGSGPVVEAAAHVLAVAGGPVMVIKCPSSTAGAAGSVTAVGTGTTVVTVTGAALDAYSVKVLIMTGGATLVAGTAVFKYSLDGGTTYSGEIAVPTAGSYLMANTGLTLVFTYTSGTGFVAGDTYAFTSTGPLCTLSEAMAACDVALASSSTFFLIHIVGAASTAANAATMATTFEAKLLAANTGLYRYVGGAIDCPVDTDANLIAAFVAYAGTHVMVCAGTLNLVSQYSSAVYVRPAGWSITARASAVPPSEDLGRVATGPCPGITSLVRDEFATQGLDTKKFATMRTIIGKIGFFVTNGRIMSTTGSDFSLLQHRRVMDIAATTARAAMLEYLNDSVRVTQTTGYILETDARAIEARIESLLRAAVTQPGYASDVSCSISRTENILSTQTMTLTFRVTPLGYAKTISGTIGFFNPALQPV